MMVWWIAGAVVAGVVGFVLSVFWWVNARGYGDKKHRLNAEFQRAVTNGLLAAIAILLCGIALQAG